MKWSEINDREGKEEGECSETLHLTRKKEKFSVMQVPRHCSLVLLVNVS
jgi:hypothetical protein